MFNYPRGEISMGCEAHCC
jgi:hypothetical protein